jgi:hypothetical protein
MVTKQTTERYPFLGSRFLISKNRRPLLGNGTVSTVPREWLASRLNSVLPAQAMQRSCKEDNWGNLVSSVLEAVKKRDREDKAQKLKSLQC